MLRQAEAPTGATNNPAGTRKSTSAVGGAASAATIHITARQPSCTPSQAPAGSPTTAASDQPRNTNAIVRARRSGATSRLAGAAACGVNRDATLALSTRTASSDQ